MQSKAKAWLGVALVVVLPIITELTDIKLPAWARFAMLMVWTIVVIFLALVIIADWFGWRSGPKSFSRRTNMIISLAGAIIGAIVAPLVWGIIPHDENDASPPKPAKHPAVDKDALAKQNAQPVIKEHDPTALLIPVGAKSVPISVLPLIPDPNQQPANPSDLNFYFYAFSATAYDDWVQYAGVTLTNRTPQKMHLELWGHVDYWKDSGEPARYGVRATWNPKGLKEREGQDFIDLDAFETKKGRLFVFLGKPDKREIGTWFLDASENVYIEVFDAVTGKRSAFKGREGYPSGQMPAPLTSHKELLKLDFPEIAEAAPVSEPLDLLVRTRDHGYNGTKAMMQALFTNLSSKPMELELSLLIRSNEVDRIWLSNEGLFEDSDGKGSASGRTLKIEPGDTLLRGLIFDLAAAGVPTTGGWALRKQPKDTLLEINDRTSGRKGWCALSPGYPPGTNMRLATILEKPPANSSNQPLEPTNDTQ